ncbi:MAG: hypothetical protein ACYC2K_15685 [Gemmatimonadales bacterium]
MRTWLIVAAAATLACTSKAIEPAQVSPSAAPAVVAGAFMRAVTDSNLTQMGSLWGTDRGPAATTNRPADWLQRLAVVHAYLKGGTSKVVGENPGAGGVGRRQLVIELTRGGCVKNIPFTMVQARDGAWIISAIDLAAAGVPGRPCATPGGNPTP